MVKSNLPNFKPLKLGVKNSITNIFAFGRGSVQRFPFKHVKINDTKTVFNINIGATAGVKEVNVKIVKGMSGTPVLNSNNEVIGIVWGNESINMNLLKYNYELFVSPENVKHGYITTGTLFNKAVIEMANDINTVEPVHYYTYDGIDHSTDHLLQTEIVVK